MLQRGHLVGWVPVCLGLGIGLYFMLLAEPAPQIYAGLGLLALAGGIGAWMAGAVLRPLLIGLVVVIGGFELAAFRAHDVAAPILGFRYYGPIEGRIVHIDRSSSEAVRLTLDQVRLDRMSPARTPARVRVSLHGDQGWLVAEPGLRVMLTGHLSPPSGPAEPGGFDFRRMAWFQGLGAVGYTRTPVLVAALAEEGEAGLGIARLRRWISTFVQARIDGDPGGFAAAVTTGDRSGLTLGASDAMRASNLFHLISISGMHMGMLAGFVFAIVRYGVALVPALALRLPARKIAALVALPAAAFYLALAGRAIPTERAFVMVAVMLIAVLLDRRAMSIRSVAFAAVIVLVARPESLLNPGFQMSFSAVVALVFAFGKLPYMGRDARWIVRLGLPVLLLLFSSLVAGSATAPYAAAHFNRVAHYGLIANLFAVPIMGMMVMPGAVILAILGPLGIEGPGLWMMEMGSWWILLVAETVSSWDGAISAVPKPPPIVLPLLTLGACFVILWQGRGRFLGLAPVALSVVFWFGAERPALLVADSGALLGVMTQEGRALSKPRGDGFVAGVWLENDGTTEGQEFAASLAGYSRQDRVTRLRVAGWDVVQVSGVTALRSLEGCGGADMLVTNVEVTDVRPCDVFDIKRLRETGALAVWDDPEGPRLETVRERVGWRLWHGPPPPGAP